MSSAYGKIQVAQPKEPLQLPIKCNLKDGTTVEIIQAEEEHLEQVYEIFNEIIKEGNTYPQEFEMDMDGFRGYFLSAAAFVCQVGNQVLGAFYIKPNFPGRCAHICNGGFIVKQDQRGRGVGKVMGQAFLKLAPLLGYKASMFNLVFVTNVASVKLWKSLGFQEIGILPKAGKLKSYGYTDAIMYHYQFE